MILNVYQHYNHSAATVSKLHFNACCKHRFPLMVGVDEKNVMLRYGIKHFPSDIKIAC